MSDDNNRLTLGQLRQLLRLFIQRGASANFRVSPKGGLEMVPDKDTTRRKDSPIPAELLPLLEQLGDDGNIPAEWLAELKRHHEQLQQLESNLTPEERAALETHRTQAETASESQLKQVEEAEELLPDAVRNTLEKQRRLRQSLAGKVTQAWKKKHMPEKEEENSSSDDGDEGESDPQSQDKKKDDKSKKSDKQQDKGDDGDDADDNADGQSDGDDGEDGDSSDGDSGDDSADSDSSNAGDSDSQNRNDPSQQGEGSPSADGSEGNGDSDAQPEDTKEGLDKYREELEQKAGQQGKGDEEDENDSNESEGDGNDGQPQDGENQDGQDRKNQSQNPKQEDSSDGLKDYEKELRKQQEEQKKQAEKQQGQEDGDGQGQGQPGQQSGQQGPGQENAEAAYGLSDMKADPADAYEAKKALERLLSRGRKYPQQLPRWHKRKLVERLMTYRSPNPARKPTLEQKAILMVIDNSPSMAHLEKQSRALAAALSAAGGPNGATVIVCLSSNGDYTHERPSYNPKSEDGLWFVNGKCVGRLPEPPKNAGFNTKSAAQSWVWFIKKFLPQKRFDVHIIGFYGDRDGAKRWSFISNTCKDIMCTWFNPEDKGKGPVQEIPNMGKHRTSSSPYGGDGWGIGGEPGHVNGDKRYETFRGKYFSRVDTIRDIATALKKAIGL